MSISAKPAGPQLATSVNLDIEALIRSADAGVADGCHCRGASFGSPDEGIVSLAAIDEVAPIVMPALKCSGADASAAELAFRPRTAP
jgi:hypothetical protein